MSAPLLSLHGIIKRFGALTAVDDVDLEVARGEKLGIIGPNGSGKTTLINCISGIARPDAGSIRFEDSDISRWPAYRRARRGIGRTFQIPRPFVGVSVIGNLLVPLDYRESGEGEIEHAHGILVSVGLAARADDPAESLTHLELRKLELARALAAAPRLSDRRRSHGRSIRAGNR